MVYCVINWFNYVLNNIDCLYILYNMCIKLQIDFQKYILLCEFFYKMVKKFLINLIFCFDIYESMF